MNTTNLIKGQSIQKQEGPWNSYGPSHVPADRMLARRKLGLKSSPAEKRCCLWIMNLTFGMMYGKIL